MSTTQPSPLSLHLHLSILVAIALGCLCAHFEIPGAIALAETVSTLFVRFLKLLSLPILFFAITSSISRLDTWDALLSIGRPVLKYTFFTTIVAATIGLILFLALSLEKPLPVSIIGETPSLPSQTYLYFLIESIPDNAIGAFVSQNVLGVALMGFLLGVATLKLPSEPRQHLAHFFDAFFQALLMLARGIIRIIPLGIWAFTVSFYVEWQSSHELFSTLARYATAIIAANFIQGFIVLPLLLSARGIAPRTLFRRVTPAILLAFFSKSSNTALPVTLDCLKKDPAIPDKVRNTAIPLCTVINMNGCAAFILITVLFITAQYGITFSFPELLLWALIATLAAIGNAGVPMGCYFLTSAFLLSFDVPLIILGWILPIYVFLDMLETALNVWSDACVTRLVSQDIEKSTISHER